MRSSLVVTALILFVFPQLVPGQDVTVARPELLLKEMVEGMPKGAEQEVRVLAATIQPGGKTVTHTHRFPVTVYILEGEFTLELAGRPPVTVKAGEAMVEPAGVKMTGYNKSSTVPMRVVIFYASDADTPFLDPEVN